MDPDLNAPVAAAQAQKGQLDTLFAGQRADTSDFLKRYTNTIGAQPTTSALADSIGGSLGLPQLQKNAQMLRDTITNLPQTYGKATRGFDVNANQLQQIISTKAGQLAPAVDTAERAVTDTQNNVDRRLGYAQADENRALLPFQSEQSLLSDRLARETTGYTTQMGSELDALIAKMNAGVTLSEGEKNRANQLAMAEKQFEYQKQLNQQQADLSGSSANDPYKSLGEGTTLFNTSTGQPVYTAPKTYAPGSSSSITPTLNNGGSFNWSQFGL